jgi:hypothetical protein
MEPVLADRTLDHVLQIGRLLPIHHWRVWLLASAENAREVVIVKIASIERVFFLSEEYFRAICKDW